MNTLSRILIVALMPVVLAGQTVPATAPGSLLLSSTFENISVDAGFANDSNGNNSASIKFRKQGDATWKDAYTPVVDRRASIGGHANPYVNQVRGSIVGLEPGTVYEVSVTFADPDGVSGNPAIVGTASTVAAVPALSGATLYVDDVGTNGNGTSGSPYNSITSAINAASAGTTIMLKPGTYPAFTVSKSGTAAGYIAIVGEVRDQVFISANPDTSITVSGNYVQLKNLRLKKPGHNGILVSGVNHVWIENIYLEDLSVSMSYDDAGILISNANNVYLLNSQILSPSMTARPAANPAWESPGVGIYVGAGVSSVVIKGNNIDGGYRDCIGNSPEDWGGGLNNSDIANNTVTNCKDDAIQMEGDDVNLRVYGNVVNANMGYSALALQPAIVGPVYIFRNVFKMSAGTGSSGLKLGGTAYQFFLQNTIHSTQSNDGFAGVTASQYLYNNIVAAANGSPVYSWAGGAKLNANLYNRSGGGSIFGSPDYETVADFRTATGQEQQGKQGDPQFIDAAAHIDSTSPAYNSGIVIPNFNSLDSVWFFMGTAPDIGAYEVAAGGPPPTNAAPTVSAGPDQNVTLPSPAALNGSASDDGLPAGSTLTSTWSTVSGPGAVTFGDAGALSTSVSLPAPGNYVLRLTASDGALSSTDDVTVTANPAVTNPPPTVTITNRVNGGTFTGNIPSFIVLATDSNGVVSVSLFVDGDLVNAIYDSLTLLPDSNPLVWRTRGIPAGSVHQIRAEACDALGACGSIAIQLTRQ